jgi:RiboL-PSP-HEPN
MATFLKEFVITIGERWQEVDLLITRAKDVQESDEQLYHVLCRSVTILLVAHLEGFTKDLAKSIIHDLNSHCSFMELPKAVQRTYCKKFLGTKTTENNKIYDNNLNDLITKFEEVGCQISNEPFHFTTNRNPSANILKTIFNNFGISNVFYYLHSSKLEDMFSMTLAELHEYTEEVLAFIVGGVEDFPYDLSGEGYGLIKNKVKTKTIWEDFLEQINKKRHSIAHGNIFSNTNDIRELEQTKSKIVLTQYAFIVILAATISKNVQH